MSASFYVGRLGNQNLYNLASLSKEQRLLTLYSESGFYYSFYETVAKAPSLKEAYHALTQNDRVESPKTVNALSRFSLSFETSVGVIYRLLNPIVPMDTFSFFINATYGFHVFLILFVFLLALDFCNRSPWAILAPFLFWAHIAYASRYLLAPVLKETCGIVFLFWHFFSLRKVFQEKIKLTDAICLILSGAFTILTWQFAQFILALEVTAFIVLAVIGILSFKKLVPISLMLLVATCLSYFLHFQNGMILHSVLMPLLLSVILTGLFVPRNAASFIIGFTALFIPLFVTITGGFDSHVFEFLKHKSGQSKSFASALYACDPAFQRMDFAELWKFFRTMAFPIWMGFGLHTLLTEKRAKFLFYTILSVLVFCIAVIAQRFVIVAAPLIFSLVAYFCYQLVSFPKLKWVGVGGVSALILLTSYFTAIEMPTFLFRTSPYQPFEQIESVTRWVQLNTLPDDVIAAPMHYSAAITLLTRRKTIVHPHFEEASLRKRVEDSYRLYSDFPEAAMMDYFKRLGVNYLIVDKGLCMENIGSASCTASDLFLHNEVKEQRLCFRLVLNKESSNYSLVARLPGTFILKLKSNENSELLGKSVVPLWRQSCNILVGRF